MSQPKMQFFPNRKVSGKILLLVAIVLLWLCVGVRADSGFEAMGYLTYTRFDASSNATHKNVMMFDFMILDSAWRVRTEPVLEGKGVAFYEAANSTNGFVLRVTGLESAYDEIESPFQTLRSEIKQFKKDDVFFANPPPPVAPPGMSNYLGAALSKAENTKKADNVAIATTFKGKYLAADQSYAAFLWFAFTEPQPLSDGSHKLLAQIWDDGNPQKIRLRRSQWSQFPESPQLASRAVYEWIGKEQLPNGFLADLNVSDVDKPGEAAATYQVEVNTNFNGQVLPINFKLTRFNPKRSKTGEQIISSTIDATVTRYTTIASHESLEVRLPGKTFVNDYRLATQESSHLALGYLVDSNALPSTNQIAQSSLYKRYQEEAKRTEPKRNARW